MQLPAIFKDRLQQLGGIFTTTRRFVFAYDNDSKISGKNSDEVLTEIVRFIITNDGSPTSRPVESTIIFKSKKSFDNWSNLILNSNALTGVYCTNLQIETDSPDIPFGKENHSLKNNFDALVNRIKLELGKG